MITQVFADSSSFVLIVHIVILYLIQNKIEILNKIKLKSDHWGTQFEISPFNS